MIDIALARQILDGNNPEVSDDLTAAALEAILEAQRAERGLVRSLEEIDRDRGFINEALGLANANAAEDISIAQDQRDLSGRDLFARANQEFRNLTKSFARRGLGDSGFAQRERTEFGDTRGRSVEGLDLQERRAISSANRQLANARLSAARQGASLDDQVFGVGEAREVLSSGLTGNFASLGVQGVGQAIQVIGSGASYSEKLAALIQAGFTRELADQVLNAEYSEDFFY